MDYPDVEKLIKILAMKNITLSKAQKLDMIQNLVCGTHLEKIEEAINSDKTIDYRHGVNKKSFY